MKPLPDVALIGAMKAGTSSLATAFDEHPKLAVARANRKGNVRKEPRIFSRDERYAKGPQWYAEHFEHAIEGQLTIDASTCYSRSMEFPNAIPRLHAANPDAKIIYVLRNPVSARVLALQTCRKRRLSCKKPIPTFAQFIEANREAIAASTYVRELELLQQYFKSSQLLILRFDQLARTPQCSWQVAEHLCTIWVPRRH